MIRSLLLAVAMGLAATGAASAHAHLVSADPADGAVVQAGPTQLKLTFSEGLEAGLSDVTVVASGKAEMPTNPAMLANDSDKVLIVPLPAPLLPGAYTVSWHALSKDGHTSHNSYSFTVAP